MLACTPVWREKTRLERQKVQAAAMGKASHFLHHSMRKKETVLSGWAIKPKGVFHLSELTGQTLSAVMRISLLIKLPTQISQILNGIQEGDNVSAKNLGKSRFPCQNDWCGYGPASQFWQMERALSVTVVIYYKTLRNNMLYVPGLQSIIFLYFFCNQNLYFL